MRSTQSRAWRRPSAALFGLALLAGCSDSLPTDPRGADLRPRSAASGADIGTFTGSIRVGVVQQTQSLKLGGTGEFVVRNKATGGELLRGTGEDVTVTLESVPVVRKFYYLQVACTGSDATRDQWVANAEAAGYHTITEFVPSVPCTRLRIGRLSEADYLNTTTRAAWRAEVGAKGLNLHNGVSFFAYTFSEGEAQFKIQSGSETLFSEGAPVVEALTGRVRIAGRQYRGTAEAGINSAGSLAGINELSMEEYLYGVVPRELGPVAYPELEAQKAQAVAARTWALVGFRKRLADGYNLRATIDDQVYGGFEAEHPLSTQAVDETAGVVATYNGRPISTFYSSTSGGHTAGYEEWLDRADPVPYLTGKLDAERGAAPENVPTLEVFKRAPISANLRAFHGGDYEADWSRYHRWSFEWTNEEMSRLLSMTYGPVGKVLAINVLERGPSGRVLKIEYVTEKDTFTSTRNGIRSSLKFINARGNPEGILSTLFFIEPVHDPRTKELAGFKAYGGGWGHGVGMSQTGAVGRAEKGATYEEILKFYYTGIELQKRY
ncbi:MAG TPA: SpoIID/LytB domain-containing protein [Longimicrobiaceae bacterium]|nr:SpoIID/LytB domain-containing protein [Longimicrobiaceae bacterium]